ncbi:MAG: hypothetical protein ACE5KY_05330 [Candidatus Tectimicrobiota bacterium]
MDWLDNRLESRRLRTVLSERRLGHRVMDWLDDRLEMGRFFGETMPAGAPA